MAGSVIRSTARQELAKRSSEFLQVTATGGSTTTVIDTNNLQYVDSYWNEQYVLFTSGANNGLTRKISAFTSASAQATLYSAVTAVASGDTAEFYRRFSPTDHNTALNAAINKSWPAFYQSVSSAVVTAIQDTLRYVVPTGLDLGDKGLIGIEYQRWTLASQATFPYQRLSTDDYDIVQTVLLPPSAPTLALHTGGLNLGVGVYRYQVTFVQDGVESAPGRETSITVTGSPHKMVDVTIPIGPTGTTARKIYRTQAAGNPGTETFLATVSDNTTTLYGSDDASDSSIVSNAGPPMLTTYKTLQLRFNPDTNRLIRLIYGSPVLQVSADSDVIGLDSPALEWLYAQGKAELWRIEANRSEAVARKDALQMVALSEGEADKLKKDLGHYWPPRPIRRTRFYLGGVV